MAHNDKNTQSLPMRIILIIILLLAAAIFCVSAYKVYTHFRTEKAADLHNEQLINKAVKFKEPAKNQEVPEATPSPAPDEPREDREIFPLTVDFDLIRRESADIKAWLYLPNTAINYPVVQAKDNSYYLDKLTNGNWNFAGSLFMDFRNSADFSDICTVIYGHNMKNGSMFGALPNYKSADFYKSHPIIYLALPHTNYKIEIFAGFATPADSFVYSFPSTENMADFLRQCVEHSDFATDFTFNGDERIAVLSTCTNSDDTKRYVVVGVLREFEE